MTNKEKIKPGTCKIVSMKLIGENVYEVTTTSGTYDRATNRVVAVSPELAKELREAGRTSTKNPS